MQNLNDVLPDALAGLENERADGQRRESGMMPLPPVQTREETIRNLWARYVEGADVPPRYRMAHLSKNCGVYEREPGKADAYRRALELAREGRITQRHQDRFCLVLAGPYGTGKTWLGTAVFKELLNRHVYLHPQYPTLSDADRGSGARWRKFYQFVREIQDGYSTGTASQTIALFQRAPVLMIDDVGELDRGQETEDRRRLLYEVIDYRNDHLLPTVLTTNLLGEAMRLQFGERTWERIAEMSALIKMEGANLRAEPLPEVTADE